ncbi:hypothetical protein NA57DRAFT_80010 [Rhizodiscina lignyota]|uniref:Uncharacterized protein n=1 Tax=Rhizodiscina lignyota TaxID=1504668 RepID=A0A9P4M1P2_9PEZI|nr:hypothetical protein NA57DRAFT_80010 [Rhizodiscina lignyota]
MSSTWMTASGLNPALTSSSYIPPDYVLGNLWKTFESFINVRNVDIAWFRDCRETTASIPSFFRSATSLTVGGQASKKFATKVLGTVEPQNLTHLCFSNLQQFAEPLPAPSDHPSLQQLVEYCANIRHHTAPGPMRGHFQDLIGKLTSLRSLRIDTFAPSSSPPTNEITTCYRDWAALIRSVSGTLTNLTVEQGHWHWIYRNPSNAHNGVHQRERPTDRLFVDHIAPAILESQWPELRELEIRGLGRCSMQMVHRVRPEELQLSADEGYEILRERGNTWIGNRIFHYNGTRAAIRRHLEPDAVVIIEEESKNFEYCENTGIPEFYVDTQGLV